MSADVLERLDLNIFVQLVLIPCENHGGLRWHADKSEI